MKRKGVEPNVVTYTTLTKGYSRVGNALRVFELFEDLKSEGVTPSEKTFNTIINTCATNGDVRKALFFLDRMKHMYSLELDEFTYGSMLKVCVEAKDLRTAKETFEEAISSGVKVNVIMLTTMIDVYAECCNKENIMQYFKECKELVEEMDAKEMNSDMRTFNVLLKLCVGGSLTKEAMEILNQIRINGIYPNVVCYNTIIDGISKDEKLSIEEMLTLSSKIVDAMTKEGTLLDTRTYNAMINVAFKAKSLKKAIQLFEQMKKAGIDPSYATYDIMIKCYEKLGDQSKPDAYMNPYLDLMAECDEKGIKLDGPGYTSLLNACANAANLDIALKLWKRMAKDGIERSVIRYNAMINVYGSVGDLEGVVDLFNEIKSKELKPNKHTYGTMIKCYEKLGDPSKPDAYLKPCLDLMAECDEKRIKLDGPCYTLLLSACANASNPYIALKLWKRLAKEGIKPNVFVYSAMISVYLRVEQVDEAFGFLDDMIASKLRPNEITYRTFMVHFVMTKNKARARKIFDKMKAVQVQPDKDIIKALKRLGLKLN
eukprot:g3181.t1